MVDAPQVAAPEVAVPEVAASANADTSESPAARLFNEGRAQLVEGRYAEACGKLAESQRLEPRVGTQLNLAFCQERLGKVATAWFAYHEARDLAQREGDAVRTEFATNWITALEPRLCWLDLQVANTIAADEVRLYVDDAALTENRWRKAQPLDPGEHVLVATYAGTEFWRSSVVLQESQRVQVAVPEPTPTIAVTARSQPMARAQENTKGVSTTQQEAAASAHHFVFQVGVMAGFMAIDTVESEPDRAPDDIEFYETDEDGDTRRVSCGTAICSYGSPDSGGAVLGVTGYAGYTLSEWVSLGLRAHAGLNLGGGTLVAAGPSLSLRLLSRFDVAPTLLLGAASHEGPADTQLTSPAGNSFNYYGRMHATTEFAVGTGVDLSMDLVRTATGALFVNTAPLFLSGANGFVWFVPVGVGWRWE